MQFLSSRPAGLLLIAAIAIPAWGGLAAQPNGSSDPNIVVEGEVPPDLATMVAGPEIKGTITARTGDRLRITGADGGNTIVTVTPATRVKAGGGLFGSGGKLTKDALLNGLPVTVKTLQSAAGIYASQVTFRNRDMKIATMIRNATSQRFDEQAAATEALRGRMADIDKYNIKGTTNVYFATGKSALSGGSKAELCATAAEAEGLDNALLLVVGYTDSTGSEEYNQILSERRAASVINYLQQVCHWKPYRMLTPTGMAEADPLASNDTAEGKAQNRRVAVNILVSKGLDGM